MAKNAQQIAANWQTAMASPTTATKYKQGIANTTVNPMALAATPEALARYQMNTAESVTSGRRAAKLQAANPQTWKDNASNIGASRLGTGAQKAAPKYAAFAQKWAPIYQQVSDTVRSMPKGGLANASARAAKAIEMLMSAAGKM